MLVDNEIAKTCWCPMVRSGELDGTDTNTVAVINSWAGQRVMSGSLCVADKCMMWRFSINMDDGYCGLAGIPYNEIENRGKM